MEQGKSTLERAFEIARSGTVLNVAELREKLKAEGYSQQQIDGPALGRQLRGLITKAIGPSRPKR